MTTSMNEFDNWKLGDTSEKYESARRGPSTISNGKGDNGGKSYGTFQLSIRTGTLNDFLESSTHGLYATQFQGIELGSTAFDKKWKEIANNDPQFKEHQYQFIKESHYERQMQNLQLNGIELSKRGPAVHDLVWSTATQYGNLTTGIFQKTFQESGFKTDQIQHLSDLELITKVQQYKKDHVPEHFAMSSPEVQKSIQEQRIPKETRDLIKLNSAHLNFLLHHSLDKNLTSPAVATPDPASIGGLVTPKDSPTSYLDNPSGIPMNSTTTGSHSQAASSVHAGITNKKTGFIAGPHESMYQQLIHQFHESSEKFLDVIGLDAEQRQQFLKIAQQKLEQKLEQLMTHSISHYLKIPPQENLSTQSSLGQLPSSNLVQNLSHGSSSAAEIGTQPTGMLGREKQQSWQSAEHQNIQLAGSLSQKQLDQIQQFFSKSPEQAQKIQPTLEQRR